MNNRTETAKLVKISAIFYNGSVIIGYESSQTDPNTINSGKRSVFTLQIVDEVIMSDAESYEFTITLQDKQSSDHFARLTGGEIGDDSL